MTHHYSVSALQQYLGVSSFLIEDFSPQINCIEYSCSSKPVLTEGLSGEGLAVLIAYKCTQAWHTDGSIIMLLQ